MKIYGAILVSFLTIILTSCASSGSGSKGGYCPNSYDSNTALWLGEFANLAYEEDRNTIKSIVESQGLTLDDYDFSNRKYSVDGFIAYDQDKVILAFSGTEDFKDLKNNVQTWSEPIEDKTCGKQIRIHSGFYKAAMKVINYNDNALFAHLAQLQKQGKKIYITGHSLGAALATIVAYYAETADESHINIAGVYTFGQPYTGDDDFQSCFNDKLKSRTFRFVSDKDIVPKTRIDSSYRHIGTFLFFDKNGDLKKTKPSDYVGDFMSFIESNLLEAHSMSGYMTLLKRNQGIIPFSCSR